MSSELNKSLTTLLFFMFKIMTLLSIALFVEFILKTYQIKLISVAG
jgi:hypothetical protein